MFPMTKKKPLSLSLCLAKSRHIRDSLTVIEMTWVSDGSIQPSFLWIISFQYSSPERLLLVFIIYCWREIIWIPTELLPLLIARHWSLFMYIQQITVNENNGSFYKRFIRFSPMHSWCTTGPSCYSSWSNGSYASVSRRHEFPEDLCIDTTNNHRLTSSLSRRQHLWHWLEHTSLSTMIRREKRLCHDTRGPVACKIHTWCLATFQSTNVNHTTRKWSVDQSTVFVKWANTYIGHMRLSNVHITT